tara:strand:+ start:340 stop:819 length:480 start_codon:yes stop_codon:yes gene_type:complete
MTRYVKTGSVSTIPMINTELEKVEVAINSTLSRLGDEPNQMEADIDLNSNRIINSAPPISNSDLVTKAYVDSRTIAGSGGNGVDKPPALTESVVLASAQTVVTFSVVNASQSVFYISGLGVDSSRLFPILNIAVDSSSQITLDESYPSGTILTSLQETA